MRFVEKEQIVKPFSYGIVEITMGPPKRLRNRKYPLHQKLEPQVLYQVHTGMRLGEIAGLTWDRVNLIERYINLRSENTKTGGPRRVYLVPQALEVLGRAKKARGLAHLYLFSYYGNPIKEIRRALWTALAKTGIKDFRFHDLRHTFNTNIRRAEVEPSVIMKLTGHKTLSMFLRYSSVDSEDAKEAVAKFRDFLDRESKTISNSTSIKKKGLSDSA